LKALRREGRRGVSPVIATLLLIVIAVAAAVLVYMWTVGYATQMRPTTPETSERLKIEAGNLFQLFTTTYGKTYVNATLYVRNIGGGPAYINGSYLLTTAQDVINMTRTGGAYKYIYVDRVGAGIKPLEAGKVHTVNITFVAPSKSLTLGGTYIVRIVTSLGSEFAIELKLRPSA
jgi:flagellin-like protein